MAIEATRPALLFDLDGTLTDPFVGITRSVQYAMEKLGRASPAADDLRWCIGPPLKLAFATLLDTDDEAAVDEGVRLYRERYSTIGKFENSLIPGIPEMLAIFVAKGYFLSIATSKLKTYAGDIIDHFDLRRYFQVLHGSEIDGRNAAKGDLVRHILATEQLDNGQDRHDRRPLARYRRCRCERHGIGRRAVGLRRPGRASLPPAQPGSRTDRPSCRISVGEILLARQATACQDSAGDSAPRDWLCAAPDRTFSMAPDSSLSGP